MVPRPVRRIMGFDANGMVSVALWLARRRHGVPPGAVAVTYSRSQTALLTMFLILVVGELAAVEALLRSLDVPAVVRGVMLVVDAYSVLAVLIVLTSCITRPHVVSADTVRIRYGVFFDLIIPRERITAVRRAGNRNEHGVVSVDGDTIVVAVSSETNLVLEMAEPVTAVRPLGRPARVRAVRWFADDPDAAAAVLCAA